MAQFRFIGDPRDGFRGPAPQELFGLVFSRDEWTDVPAALAEKAASHSHLERRPEKARAGQGDDLPQPNSAAASGFVVTVDPVSNRGAAAKADGKKRNVPPAYRGKPEEARWLAGYDGVSDENAD